MSEELTYLEVRKHERFDRTVEVNESTLVDVDTDGRILGVECLNGSSPNWYAILADDRFGFRS